MYSSDGYRALRSGKAFVRRADRGLLSVTGADRLGWLQGLLTNVVSSLAPGGSCYSAYLTPQGRMIADMRVVHLSDRTLLEVPGALAEALRARLDALLFAEDAQVRDATAEIDVIDVRGPHSAALIHGAAGVIGDAADTAIIAMVPDESDGVSGTTVFVNRTAWDTLRRALVDHGGVETTLETLDVLRIEAGKPLFLVDMDEHTIPLEAGLEKRAISFTKGCYVGQEVIVRVMQRGQGRVAKKLVGFLFPKDVTPRVGDLVRTDDRDIGRLTSVTRSPTLERPIALGYVHREFTDAGTTVHVATKDGVATASIAPLPFVSTVTPSR
jgi:folate-binding protein YgfZ